MATPVGTTPRPPKALGNQRYQDEVADGKPDIVDAELDDDIGTLYDLCNGGLTTANLNANADIKYTQLHRPLTIVNADITNPQASGGPVGGGISGTKIQPGTVVITGKEQITVLQSVWAQGWNGDDATFTFGDNLEHLLCELAWSSRGGYWIAWASVQVVYPLALGPAANQQTFTARLKIDGAPGDIGGTVYHQMVAHAGGPAGSATVFIDFALSCALLAQNGFQSPPPQRAKLTGQVSSVTPAGLPYATTKRLIVMEQC